MSTLGPLTLVPRLDPKPWGGRRLTQFGLSLPPGDLIGEAVITAPEAVIRDGHDAGRTLEDIVTTDPAAALGPLGLAATGNRPIFPLLIKLIDAAENLSIQVHPPDEVAVFANDNLGKTEAWHILAAQPGGALYLGLWPGLTSDTLAVAARAGQSTASLMRGLPAQPNTTVLIPAGTVHALGAGVLIYEIQQPSAITYRLDDWGRVDSAGNPRQLHIEQGLAVMNPGSRPELIPPILLRTPAGRRQLLTACRYFALERIALAAGESVPLIAPGGPQALTCLRGAAGITADGRESALTAGETAVLLASSPAGELRAAEPAIILRAWVPDLARDIMQPGHAAGAADDALARLSAPPADLSDALTRR